MIASHDRPLRLGVAPPVSQQIIGVQTIYWCFDELLALPPALPSAFSARRARALEGILSAFSAKRARALEGILSAFSAMRGELLPPRHPLSMPLVPALVAPSPPVLCHARAAAAYIRAVRVHGSSLVPRVPFFHSIILCDFVLHPVESIRPKWVLAGGTVNRTASIMKMMTRLTSFARLCAVVVAALLSVGGFGGTNDGDAAVLMARAQPLAGPRCVNRFPQKPLCKFVDDLAASPLTFLDASTGETINLGAYAVSQKFHRDLPATKVYAHGVSRDSVRYPGPVLVAKRGVTTKVNFPNYIEDKEHMFTIDPTLMTPNLTNGGVPISNTVDFGFIVHLHGGETPSKSEGHSKAWYTASGERGPEFASEVHTYPNMQRATTLWYHDHTMGLTALNMAAGMAGLYIIRDPQGEEKQFKKWMPSDERQLHLVIADRMFFANGSINYPNQGFVPNVHPNWIPGYIGDTNVVNGKVWPYLEVRRAMYRIRMVNAANARTYNLTFQCAAAGDSNFTLPLAGPMLPFYLYIPPVVLEKAVKERWLALTFVFDPVSQLPSGMLLDGKPSSDPATETPQVVSTAHPRVHPCGKPSSAPAIEKPEKPSGMLLDGKPSSDPATETPQVVSTAQAT
ncbi:unnamed protein product [Closterium sp. Yama58-4]|nr:unnamed protein product [Closterium sp. Yama58-4]